MLDYNGRKRPSEIVHLRLPAWGAGAAIKPVHKRIGVGNEDGMPGNDGGR